MTLITHKKKRIEIIVEAALAPQVERLIKHLKAKCVVTAAVAGGQLASGPLLSGQLSGAFAHVHFLVVAGEALAEQLVRDAQVLLAEHTAVILLSDVEVLRDDHF